MVHPLARLTPSRRVLLGLLFLTLAGCGSGMATVTGKVTYKGEPLPNGTVIFVGENATQASSPLDPEGKYRIQIPPGEAKIMIYTTGSAKGGMQGPKEVKMMKPGTFGGEGKESEKEMPQVKGPKIPPQYSDRNTTPLKYTVKSGSQEHNITLE